ncbi:UNVERIFIED_CONTAM: hypothetical protein Sradi_2989900 [Sesamum radiatum]|uniref:Reverse transcriptase domain-containing protein n=1 Tax=Sesamum radiatum TaxID=300843 RepID=A0AAW2S0C5_SESRA
MTCFLVVDMPSAYNLVPGCPTLNTFQAVISTYHMKLKFPVGNEIGEVQGDQYTAKKCYIEAIKNNTHKMEIDTPSLEEQGSLTTREEQRCEGPTRVQELMVIQLVPRESDKTTKIGSQLSLH